MWSILISTSLRLETFEAINYMRSVNICWRFLMIVVLWYIVALLSFGRNHGENKGYRWAQAALLRLIQAFWQLTQGRASYILAFEAPSTRLRAKTIAVAQVVMCCILLVTSPLGLYLLDPGALNAGAKTEPFRNFFMQVFQLSLAATLSCQRWKSALLKSFAKYLPDNLVRTSSTKTMRLIGLISLKWSRKRYSYLVYFLTLFYCVDYNVQKEISVVMQDRSNKLKQTWFTDNPWMNVFIVNILWPSTNFEEPGERDHIVLILALRTPNLTLG
jgi:hypothetical protein